MKNMKIKIGIFCLLILFLSIVAVSANDNATETIQIDEDNLITVENQNADTLKDNGTFTPSQAQITVNQVEGNEGQTLTLKATVKAENGSASPATVKFTFNGNTYTAPTDSSGVASVTLKFPKSAILKTTSKTKGKILTKTTYYQKSYTCNVSAEGDELQKGTASFNVISKKIQVQKYKIIKKKKTYTLKLKNGIKISKSTKGFRLGKYAVVIDKNKKGSYTYYDIGLGDKDGNILKFSIRHHYNQNGKWKWDKWLKVPKNKINTFYHDKSIKMDKIKVKFTQVSYKKI